MTLLVQLLGPVQVSRDGDPIDLPGYKPLAMLAYLLLTGKAHSRQHLVDLLFEGPDDPRAALRWTLSRLRGAIGAEYILADRQEVGFNFESDYWLDVAAFEAGDLELYRGDFLEGLHVREAYRFEDWVFFERERLRGSYQAALTWRLEEYEGRGDYPALVETAHQLLRLDNLREGWYRALMGAYARLGRREAALAQFAQCRQVLQAELGVDPVAETVALVNAIQQGLIQPAPLEAGVAAVVPGVPAAREVIPAAKPSPPRRFPTSLVGRVAEMAALHQVWHRVVEGAGQIVLVEGEPGIGKTRLIEELLTEVADQAFILRAKCPQLQEPLAYTLFVDPLREALSGGRPSGLTDTWLAEVSRLLPELHDRYPNLPQPAQLDPPAERRRLFDAVCATLLALTQRRPLALFLDDLQWADPTSLELLNHLSGWISKAPVLIIGAYRTYEVAAEHPLQRPRRDWGRTGFLTSLALGPLSDEEVADLLQELTTWTGDDPSFGVLIYRETAGNPLFVVETVSSLREEGRLPQSVEGWLRDFRVETLTIPSQVHTIIETRLDRLDDLSRQLITAAAVMRSSFEAEVVQVVSGRSELETLESLERLLASGLLVERGEDRYAFGHDKIREVAYQGLSHLRRKLLHRRMAETLERRHRGQERTVAERLAYHYDGAGVWEKALDYYLQAGHMAREQYAHEAAIRHYEKALTYLKERGDHGRSARTLMQLGLAYHTTFDFRRARQAYQEGFVLWQRASQVQPEVSLPPAPHAFRGNWPEPLTLDSTVAWDVNSTGMIQHLFSGLVELRPEMDIVPDVAHSWEVLEGGRRYVFHLREDVCWSDGRPVTAGDFEYAWKRVLDPATGSPNAELLYDVKGSRTFHQGQAPTADGVGVRALDDLTLVVELEEPTGYFLNLLAYHATFPMPRHVVEQYGATWTDVGNIVSNGPFRLEAWQSGQSIILSRNPNYHGRFGGNVQRIEDCLCADGAVTLQMYEAGDLDIWGLVIRYAEMDRLRQRHAGEYFSGPRTETEYVGFDPSRPPFDDVRVRRALVHAIDREMLADVVLRGYESPATGGFVPPGMPGHSAGIGLAYDPDRARQLLAEAGYPGGRGFPVVTAWTDTDPARVEVTRALQAQWRESLGVEIGWEIFPWAVFLDKLHESRPHLFPCAG